MGKAPGADGITNQVIKEAPETLATILAALLNTCTATGIYPASWKRENTIILKKPGKPDYTSASAYRPIALLSCLSKVLEATVARRMQDFAEDMKILPEGHYGGRAQRSTTDALLNLTVWTKNQWARGKAVGTLFVDVKAAFPTVNPTRLCDTLDKMGFCPSLTELTKNFLQDRSTTFQLGDYQSDPKILTIGLPQGSPLLVILYILYNTPLLRQADDIPNTISLGFIDDVAFATAQPTIDEVTTHLQTLANKELEWGSKYGAAFDRAKSQWMLLTHKPLPSPNPILRLGEVELEPQDQIKWLGVLINRKLSFTGHVNSQIGKGSVIANRLACLARTGWGIPLRQCKILTAALVHARVDYACVAWHRYGKTKGYPAKLQRVDNIAHRFALGVFRTHPTPFLRHDTCSPSAASRLDAKTDSAILRLLSLPDTNPAARLTKAVFNRNRQTHRSTLHHALGHPRNVSRTLPGLPEVLEMDKAGLPPPPTPRAWRYSAYQDRGDRVRHLQHLPPPSPYLHLFQRRLPSTGEGSRGCSRGAQRSQSG